MMTSIYEGFRGVGWKALKLGGYSAPEIEDLTIRAKKGYHQWEISLVCSMVSILSLGMIWKLY